MLAVYGVLEEGYMLVNRLVLGLINVDVNMESMKA